MSYVQTQTFDFKDVRDELAMIDNLINLGVSKAALEVLIARRDVLTSQPKLKIYNQAEERA